VWDSDGSKIFELNPSGTVVMFAGGEHDTGEVISRFAGRKREFGKYKELDKEMLAAHLQRGCR
jgi:hypothetical protein